MAREGELTLAAVEEEGEMREEEEEEEEAARPRGNARLLERLAQRARNDIVSYVVSYVLCLLSAPEQENVKANEKCLIPYSQTTGKRLLCHLYERGRRVYVCYSFIFCEYND
jgi:hypothetical protein